jgi:hypothetical protein
VRSSFYSLHKRLPFGVSQPAFALSVYTLFVFPLICKELQFEIAIAQGSKAISHHSNET